MLKKDRKELPNYSLCYILRLTCHAHGLGANIHAKDF